MRPILVTSYFALKFLSHGPRKRFVSSFEFPEQAYQKTVERIQKGGSKVLFYETTSGSSGAKKEVPYTRSLLRCFQNMFFIWAYDVLTHAPVKLESGKVFMSISPKIGSEKADEDSEYLGIAKYLMSQFFAVDPNLNAPNSDEYMWKLCSQLVNCRDLEVLSLWSPSYFLAILDYIEAHQQKLLGHSSFVPTEQWSQLKMISCWTDGQSNLVAQKLKQKFPQVWLQPKGLMATEAPMTIPWIQAGGSVPLLSEIPLQLVDLNGHVSSCWEAKVGKTYEVLLSTPNGLNNYSIGDLVKVKSYYKKIPVLEFVGRKNRVSDLVGEKLHEVFVFEALGPLIKQSFILVPQQDYYLLLTENSQTLEVQKLDEALCGAYHYQLARNLGQLKALKSRSVKNVDHLWLQFSREQGQLLGDVKPTQLITRADLAQKFLDYVSKAEAIS